MATRADNRDGSCREVNNGHHAGKWRVQYTQIDQLGRKQRLSRLFATKADGKEFLQQLRHGTRVEAARQKKDLTLAGWFDWLVENDWPESLDDKTIGIRVGRFDKHVRKRLGGVPLIKLNPLAIRAFYTELREAGVGQSTVIAVKSNLVRVFNQAITPYQRVPMTVANPFRLTLQSAPPRDAVALTPETARKALQSQKLTDESRAMLGVYLLAGLRLSEQMALTREQLLFHQDLILVDRAVRLDKTGKQSVGLPKGNKTRLAVMSPSLNVTLQRFVEELRPDQYLWSAIAENKPRMKTRVYAAWQEIVKLAELPAGMSPHDCRLTHINWIEKLMPDVSPTTLKEHVGHAASGVTEVNYTRPLTSSQAILRDGIERVISCLGQAKSTARKR